LEQLLKVEQVAEWLAFRPSTVRAYCERGKMPHVRIGGQLRFRREDVAAWIEEHAHRSRTPGKHTTRVASS